MSTIKVIAVLLHYPDEQLQANADELIAVLDAEGLIRGRRRAGIVGFITQLRDGDLLERQAEYVETFDRGRSRSLYLYEHLHGESRDRGRRWWSSVGCTASTVSRSPAPSCPTTCRCSWSSSRSCRWSRRSAGSRETGPVLQRLHARPAERDSAYQVLMEPLVRLAGLTVDESVREEVAREARDDTPEALDRVWMEAPVTFGPEGGCGTHRQGTGRRRTGTSVPSPSRGETLWSFSTTCCSATTPTLPAPSSSPAAWCAST
ncbi:MAG: nitrate reductase molybdenum cofactor assembly chaperone [Gammaproteobacteria bacterium]|nr:nitrate reductase molybdenum cofactor assembly chaperone [Gammaproteobacteria bacterium]